MTLKTSLLVCIGHDHVFAKLSGNMCHLLSVIMVEAAASRGAALGRLVCPALDQTAEAPANHGHLHY